VNPAPRDAPADVDAAGADGPGADGSGSAGEASWRAEPGTEVYDQMRDRIVDAAQRHLEQHGLARVRIEEIATEAGCSRATVYRYFSDKEELVRQVLIRRARRIAAALARSVQATDDPEELLVTGIVRGVAHFRADPYFESFYGPDAAGTTTRIAGGSGALRAVVGEVMGPLFDLAEATGRLRPGVDRQQATEWIMLVTTALLTIPTPSATDPADQERFLHTFLVPSLFAPER
jgi:AcrR family transcriptional regulator